VKTLTLITSHRPSGELLKKLNEVLETDGWKLVKIVDLKYRFEIDYHKKED